jgi:hypothetical protein
MSLNSKVKRVQWFLFTVDKVIHEDVHSQVFVGPRGLYLIDHSRPLYSVPRLESYKVAALPGSGAAFALHHWDDDDGTERVPNHNRGEFEGLPCLTQGAAWQV